MIDFIPLASSSSGCAYLLKSEGHAPLLIDAGLPFGDLQKFLWSEGVNVSDLAGVLISHGHSDHCKAVGRLTAEGVDCYASRDTFGALGFVGHRARIIHPTNPQVIREWYVSCFQAEHDYENLGFFIMSRENDRLLYLTDSAYCPHRFEGLTHVCVEANFSEELLKENAMAGRVNVEVAKRTLQTHASIERVIDMLLANDLSKVEAIWLLHLSDGNSNAEDFRLRVQKATGRATYIAPRRKSL